MFFLSKLFKKKQPEQPEYKCRKAVTIKDFSDFGIPEGTVVIVTGSDAMRGFEFRDDAGHCVAETGWHSVRFLED